MVVVRSIITLEIDRGRYRGAQRGHELGHAVDGLDDVGVRLPADDDEHRRLAVGRSRVAQVLHRVDHLGDVGEPDRGAVAVGDDQRR
jgi:hypothetical protein